MRPSEAWQKTAPPPGAARRPTLLNGCAHAVTAAEARFRIEYPFTPRDSRIVALDAGAAAIVCRTSARPWSGNAHFLTFGEPMPGGQGGPAPGDQGGPGPDARLRTCAGASVLMSEELSGADVTVMVATSGGHAASLIGRACAERGVMTAGIAFALTAGRAGGAVAALRPYAPVLLECSDEEDLIELLTALRA